MRLQTPIHQLTLALLLLSGFSPLYGQTAGVLVQHLSLEQGLSSTHVMNIVQDKSGFLWIGTWKGLNRYDGHAFKVFRNDPENAASIANDAVYGLLAGRDGTIWVGTPNGLDRFDHATESFHHYVFESKDSAVKKNQNTVLVLAEDREGAIWAGCQSGLYRLDPKTEKITAFASDPHVPGSLRDNRIRSLYIHDDGMLWVGTMKGLDRYDPDAGRFLPTAAQMPVSGIIPGNTHLLYLATTAGLYCIDPTQPQTPPAPCDGIRLPLLIDRYNGAKWHRTGEGLLRILPNGDTEKYSYYPNDADGLSSANVRCMFQDREGNIWIGTDNGLNMITQAAYQFRHYKHVPDQPATLSHNLILSVYEGRDGTIWLGTMGGGLNRLDPANGTVKRYPFDKSDSPHSTNSGNIFRVIEDFTGTIWIGLLDKGLDRLDPKTGIFTHYRWKDMRDMVSFFYESRDSVLWIGHQGGVSRYNRFSNDFEFTPYAPEATSGRGVVTGILEDHTGAWWVCSNGYYLNRFDPDKRQFRRYLPDASDPASIRSDNIQAIYEDRKGRLWVAAINGLDRYVRDKDQFVHFGLKDGLPDLIIGHLLEDGSGRLWMATGKGIARFDEPNQRFYAYDKADGLSSNESWDFIKSPATGAFLLATANGLTVFHPDSLTINQVAPPVVFTRFTRYNSRENKEIEVRGIAHKTSLTLSPYDDVLSIEFAALSYAKAGKNQFAYKLEGLHAEWIPLGSKRQISFSGLAPGTYVLRVKAANGDGIWNESGASLRIVVPPHWYQTWGAYAAYLLLLTGVGYFIYRLLKNRWFLRSQLQREHDEAERLKELNALKTRLYTHISHEFRTPLTVINGMAEQIRSEPEEKRLEGVEMIERNSQYLLRLVNQMLDLRKMEDGRMPLHLVQGDIIPFVRFLLESFHSQAREKDINLHFKSQQAELMMDYDPDKFQKIVFNLLSNALKFTPPGGEIGLFAGTSGDHSEAVNHTLRHDLPGSETFVLKVWDTGIGIPVEKQPYIFDHFYQAEDLVTRKEGGTGIGLALTRELVRILGGHIEVQSIVGIGTEFSIRLPLTRKAEISTDLSPAMENHREMVVSAPPFDVQEMEQVPRNERPTVLLMEDNVDVIKYLAGCLQNEYHLLLASNGKAGVEKAFQAIPDLIVSDVMMPEMNGFEACKILKNDDRTSHIPIVMLTAKADAESRLEGIDCGADAYLAKPFDHRELLLQIRKLLELRQKMQAHYLMLLTATHSHSEESPFTGTQGREDAFIQKVRELVVANLNNSQFSVVNLSRDMAMSRSQLNRKLTALAGMPPNHYIRLIKLEKACQLLRETEYQIAEIAYESGFNDPGYFSRLFRQVYHMTPVGWREQQQHRDAPGS